MENHAGPVKAEQKSAIAQGQKNQKPVGSVKKLPNFCDDGVGEPAKTLKKRVENC